VDPTRAKRLSDKELPKAVKQRTDTDEAKRDTPSTDMDDPTREKQRRETELPTWRNGRNEMEDPKRETSFTDR
jgi:hypothetical protein